VNEDVIELFHDEITGDEDVEAHLAETQAR
jgi:hypothetical protein